MGEHSIYESANEKGEGMREAMFAKGIKTCHITICLRTPNSEVNGARAIEVSVLCPYQRLTDTDDISEEGQIFKITSSFLEPNDFQSVQQIHGELEFYQQMDTFDKYKNVASLPSYVPIRFSPQQKSMVCRSSSCRSTRECRMDMGLIENQTKRRLHDI